VIPLYDQNPARRLPVVTIVLICINAAMFVFALLLPRAGLTLEGFYSRAGLIPYELANRVDIPPSDLVPWWATPLTSMFMHGGWLHVIFNMLFLWIFGNNVEELMGRARFVAFYLVCGLAAAFTQVVVNAGSTTPMIGASGAVAGVLGAYILMWPRARVMTLLILGIFFPVVEMPAWVLLGIWFVLQAVQGATTLGAESDVAYFAHVGGFAAGMVLVWLFAAGRRQRRGRA